MDVKEAIERRRSLRSLESAPVPKTVIEDLAKCAGLAPSCFNKQPWRFVFAVSKDTLGRLFACISPGNSWAFDASLVIAVCGKREYDCIMKDGRYYHHFDTGMACALLMLRATELGLETHAIAGYDQAKVKEVLTVPADVEVITLIIVGKKTKEIKPSLSSEQAEDEITRPDRNPLTSYVFYDKYGAES